MVKVLLPHEEKKSTSLVAIQNKKLDEIQDTQSVMLNEQRVGLLTIAQQNEELKKQNEEFSKTIELFQNRIKLLVEEAAEVKRARDEKAMRKQKHAKRKRLPKRDPMTLEIHKELMADNEGPSFLQVRLRLAFCILLVTGIRINELLPLKVYQLRTLVQEGWIAIDRSKRGPSNHKAFLTSEGKQILKAIKKDFELLFLIKEPDHYIFTSESNPNTPITRETLTKAINVSMRRVSKKIVGSPNTTSHSFRIGYITKLWKNTKDLEFVRQSIGHRGIQTTSSYVTHMSDKERQDRINGLTD
ncbi:tyrosine-type recombinase/integrase [Polaribacter sp.]|jgi:integrase|uniref:tyrosine-type recombinase/integrase n=1 Tax=Polaribacter sp. TaxID=1920175 RepID=UPI003EF05E51